MKNSKKNKNFFKAALLCCVLAFGFACGRISFSQENTNSTTVEPKEQLSSLQKEIRAMQTADFQFIYVFKRKDGGEFDKEDRDFLRANRTDDINRWSSTDDKKAYIAGSNYDFRLEHLQNLRKRFIVENYSKPSPEENPAENVNQNTNR